MGLDIAKQSLNYVLRFGVSDTDGAATDADSTPYGRLLLDGTIDAATVNIIDDGIGDYYASGTIPANATIGSLAQLQVNAIVGSTSGAYTTIWQGRIVPDNIYDSFILGTDYLETELTNSSTSGIWQTNSRTLTGTKQTFDDLNDLSQTDILSDSTPFNGSNIDASISSRATNSGVWNVGSRTLTGVVDANITEVFSSSGVAADIKNMLDGTGGVTITLRQLKASCDIADEGALDLENTHLNGYGSRSVGGQVGQLNQATGAIAYGQYNMTSNLGYGQFNRAANGTAGMAIEGYDYGIYTIGTNFYGLNVYGATEDVYLESSNKSLASLFSELNEQNVTTSGNLTTILNKLPDSYIAGSSSSEGKVNLSDDENIYHCNVQVNFDDSQTRDEYTAFFYQNSTLTEASGMSITVMQRDGSSLIDGQSMTEIGSSNVYKYDTTSAAQRVPSGTSALVTISGLVSGNSNIFSTLIGRT
ncbi:MAG: hypothetical protein BAJALOKI3v1_50138 [Promethearchaeota archaeon]|nr:MAG: hypothetical protein BAJALOKI3v1_50138 [Candidatus Lokiarchaeota archaeon]